MGEGNWVGDVVGVRGTAVGEIGLEVQVGGRDTGLADVAGGAGLDWRQAVRPTSWRQPVKRRELTKRDLKILILCISKCQNSPSQYKLSHVPFIYTIIRGIPEKNPVTFLFNLRSGFSKCLRYGDLVQINPVNTRVHAKDNLEVKIKSPSQLIKMVFPGSIGCNWDGKGGFCPQSGFALGITLVELVGDQSGFLVRSQF